MPYRHAHYYLPLLFPAALVAFWPGYFSNFGGAPYVSHLHGITGSMWIALLTLQSWSIHQRHTLLHRSVGLWSLLLFPLFTVGGLLMIHSMAGRFATHTGGPFIATYGARLGASADALSVAGVAYLFVMGLRHRRNVQLHARYLLTTIFFFFSPVLTRLSLYLPHLSISGPADMHRFAYSFHLWNVVAAMFALHLYLQAPRWGRPLLVVACFMGMQSILFETLGRWSAWEELFASFADVPLVIVTTFGLATSFAVVWRGWNSGRDQEPIVQTR
jgi:hypothetical protein